MKNILCVSTVALAYFLTAPSALSQYEKPAYDGALSPREIVEYELSNSEYPDRFSASVSIPLVVDSRPVAIAESISYEIDSEGKKVSPEAMNMSIPFPAGDFSSATTGNIDEAAYFKHLEHTLSRITLATATPGKDRNAPNCAGFPPGAIVAITNCTEDGIKWSDGTSIGVGTLTQGIKCISIDGRNDWYTATYEFQRDETCDFGR